VNRHTAEIEHAWPHHSDERHRNDIDLSGYDYRSFNVDGLDVIWAWIFSACIILLLLVVL
jgi:hypothetical protein